MPKLSVPDMNAAAKEIASKSYLVAKITVGLSGIVPNSFFRASRISIEERLSGEIVYHFRSLLAGRKYQKKQVIATMDIPISWWEHTKERFAPKWFIKKYPVRYDTVEIKKVYEITNICPHIDLPAGNAQHFCMLLDDGIGVAHD